MKFLYDTYENIAHNVKIHDKYIVVYGAGMIGTVWVPYFIQKYQLCDRLLYYIDKDKRKQESTINIGSVEYAVKTTDYLRKIPKNVIILITNSNYASIVKMLDEMEELRETEGYIVPILQVIHTHAYKQKYELKTNKEQLIPKKIH